LPPSSLSFFLSFLLAFHFTLYKSHFATDAKCGVPAQTLITVVLMVVKPSWPTVGTRTRTVNESLQRAIKQFIWVESIACHSALQPWVSLGLLYDQSPLLSIPHLLFPSFHLHLFQITLNIV
jgi:hypothetical protein